MDPKKATKAKAKWTPAPTVGVVSVKRSAQAPPEPPFSERLGDILLAEHKLEEMGERVSYLDDWRKLILDARSFLAHTTPRESCHSSTQ